jgi:hypothetical protein
MCGLVVRYRPFRDFHPDMAGPPQSRASAAPAAGARQAATHPLSGRGRILLAGGTEGNERLTVLTGLLLIVLLAAVGVTIVRIGQLLWLHLFLGMALLGPVALKLLSTGYRFVRYYTRDAEYRAKGPPPAVLRGLAPFVVLTTLGVLGTGVALLVIGPSSRGPLVELHKITFVVWIVLTGAHVLGHLPDVAKLLVSSAGASRVPTAGRESTPGAVGRWLSLATALALGLVLAAALIPLFHAWAR